MGGSGWWLMGGGKVGGLWGSKKQARTENSPRFECVRVSVLLCICVPISNISNSGGRK